MAAPAKAAVEVVGVCIIDTEEGRVCKRDVLAVDTAVCKVVDFKPVTSIGVTCFCVIVTPIFFRGVMVGVPVVGDADNEGFGAMCRVLKVVGGVPLGVVPVCIPPPVVLVAIWCCGVWLTT